MTCVIPTASSGYRIENPLNAGVYGKVFKCTKLDTQEVVAVKMVKSKYRKIAKKEHQMLKKLGQLDPDSNNLVRFIESFKYKGSICFAFESLEQTLFDFMCERNIRPLTVSEIRPIAQQMLVALDALKNKGVIHTDIKLDNIMLVNHELQPYQIKLIDFGLAVKKSELRKGARFQPLGYRAPEVILGNIMDESIDMWSLGCVLAGLFIGRNLYSGFCEYEVIRAIVHLQGMPQKHQIEKGFYAEDFFTSTKDFYGHTWRLKSPQEYYKRAGFNEKHLGIYNTINSLDELPKLHDVPDDPVETKAFIDLLKKMLHINPQKRITPNHALKHGFIMNDLILVSNDPAVTQPPLSTRRPKLEKTAIECQATLSQTVKLGVVCDCCFPFKYVKKPKETAPIKIATGSKRQKDTPQGHWKKSNATWNTDSSISCTIKDTLAHVEVRCKNKFLKRIRCFFSRIFKCFTSCCKK